MKPRSKTTIEDTVTFRIRSDLKAKLDSLAKRENKSLDQLMRDLASDRLMAEEREEFEAEARRQSREAAVDAQDKNSDEAHVMRELESDIREFDDEWN